MPVISIAKKHALSHRKAKDVADKIARDLKKRFALDYAWEGDDVDFEARAWTAIVEITRQDLAVSKPGHDGWEGL